jgi:hypothetical protein
MFPLFAKNSREHLERKRQSKHELDGLTNVGFC